MKRNKTLSLPVPLFFLSFCFFRYYDYFTTRNLVREDGHRELESTEERNERAIDCTAVNQSGSAINHVELRRVVLTQFFLSLRS